MAQVKIYGIREQLVPIRQQLSDAIHNSVVEALQFPVDKRAHRFMLLDKDDMFAPAGRTDAYIIIEILMMTGRSVGARKNLVRLLFDNIVASVGIGAQDIEICIIESPACNWGFRGMHGDEVVLNYKIEV